MSEALRILFVDDSEDDVLLIVRELRKHGLEFSYIRIDTEAALERAIEQRWDVVIADHTIPGFGGIPALKTLSTWEVDVPVIMVSGSIDEESAVAALKAGAHDFIVKGKLARLVPAIEREIEDAANRRKTRLLEEQLRHTRRIEAIGRLAGGIAHDFNNILTAIRGHADFLIDASAEDGGSTRDAYEIRKATERAAALTRQLLAFSRQQVLQPTVLEVNQVIAGVEQMLRRVIGEDIDLVTQLDPGAGRIKADRGQIEQVIMNLVVNARDAMPRGGTLRIATESLMLEDELAGAERPAGRYVVISITDTGIGMDPETTQRIFEPFFTTKPVGSGTGLGLATAYGIVRQSGGFFEVHSEPGRGSTFGAFLPSTEEQASPLDPAGETGDQQPPANGPFTILLVEDDFNVRAISSRALRRAGYTVIEAESGDQAVDAFGAIADQVDLLLIDAVMPGLTGREAAELMTIVRPDLRVVFMSGYTEDEIIQREAVTHGISFLAKPFSPAELVRKIGTELGGRPAAFSRTQ